MGRRRSRKEHHGLVRASEVAKQGDRARREGTIMGVRRRWKGEASAIGLACAVFVGMGCGGGGESGGGPSREEQILATVAAAGKVVPLGQDADNITASDTVEEGDYRVTYEQHDAIRNLENVVYLGLNDDLIWPGALVKGTHAHDFVFEPIAVARGPITLSVSLEGSGSGVPLSVKVDDPKLSTVRQGISGLVAAQLGAGVTVPARVDYRQEQVANESHLNIAVGADVKYGAGSISSRFDWSSTTKQTKVLAKYTQIYYTVDMDTPTSPLQFFGAVASPADVATAMPPGSLPLYVASVGYGMMAIMCIETDFTAEEMRLALDAAYSGGVDVEVRFGYTAQDVLQKSNITIIVYGGGTKGLSEIETGFEGFLKVIHASQNYGADTPGVPIVYKFRHVRDNTLGLVSMTSQYTLVRPLQIKQRIRVLVERFVCEMADDEGLDNTVDITRMMAWTTAWQGSPLARVPPGEQQIYRYEGAAIEMDAGSVHTAGQEVVVAFDTATYDFADARLDLRAFAEDDDGIWSGNERDDRTLSLTGRQIFENAGRHNVMLYSPDFRFRVEFVLSDGTLP
jgi:thiol-activated cytolysin